MKESDKAKLLTDFVKHCTHLTVNESENPGMVIVDHHHVAEIDAFPSVFDAIAKAVQDAKRAKEQEK